MTHDEDCYMRSHNDEQTYIEVCSGKRNLEEDYIYIYQEIPDCDNFFTNYINDITPPITTSSLVKEAMENAAQLGINLTPGSPIKSDGNCAFSAIIENVNSRACFNMNIDLSPTEARRRWLDESMCSGFWWNYHSNLITGFFWAGMPVIGLIGCPRVL